MLRSVFLALLITIVGGWAKATQASDKVRAALRSQVESRLEQYGKDAKASVWIGPGNSPASFEFEPDVPRPTASSIKTFFLVELFAKYLDRLDEILPEVKEILDDETHPAISHFPAEERQEIRHALGGASVRRIGKLMMGTERTSNHVYNAAANVTIAVLGGPAALTKAIHLRDAAFESVRVNRYMLRDRKEHGDNVASAAALASVYQRLVSPQWREIDRPTHEAIVDAIKRTDDPRLGRGRAKRGNLGTNPLTHVDAGWWNTSKGPLIYVIMLEQACPTAEKQRTEAARLRKLCDNLRNQLSHMMAEDWKLEE